MTHSHAEPYRGSLTVTTPEGTDPCHDDPYAMPSGSLRTDLPEGTDPCHPGEADIARKRAEKTPEADPAGLNLNISGDEIVRGFVWGEILNRKRA